MRLSPPAPGSHPSDGNVAVSTAGAIDARLLTRLTTFAAPVAAGRLTASDHELWTFNQNAGAMTCTNLADLVGGKTLGVRESAPGPLANHGFAKLVADPKRPRLYGLDTLKQVVVEIDPATGAALRQVLVGSGPTDLEIDPTGTFLYTGHSGTQGLAQIDAESLTFKRFIPTRYVDFDVALLGADRIAVIDAWEWTTPSLIDVGTGTMLDSQNGGRYEGQLAATTDGKSLFVADNPASRRRPSSVTTSPRASCNRRARAAPRWWVAPASGRCWQRPTARASSTQANA